MMRDEPDQGHALLRALRRQRGVCQGYGADISNTAGRRVDAGVLLVGESGKAAGHVLFAHGSRRASQGKAAGRVEGAVHTGG